MKKMAFLMFSTMILATILGIVFLPIQYQQAVAVNALFIDKKPYSMGQEVLIPNVAVHLSGTDVNGEYLQNISNNFSYNYNMDSEDLIPQEMISTNTIISNEELFALAEQKYSGDELNELIEEIQDDYRDLIYEEIDFVVPELKLTLSNIEEKTLSDECFYSYQTSDFRYGYYVEYTDHITSFPQISFSDYLKDPEGIGETYSRADNPNTEVCASSKRLYEIDLEYPSSINLPNPVFQKKYTSDDYSTFYTGQERYYYYESYEINVDLIYWIQTDEGQKACKSVKFGKDVSFQYSVHNTAISPDDGVDNRYKQYIACPEDTDRLNISYFVSSVENEGENYYYHQDEYIQFIKPDFSILIDEEEITPAPEYDNFFLDTKTDLCYGECENILDVNGRVYPKYCINEDVFGFNVLDYGFSTEKYSIDAEELAGNYGKHDANELQYFWITYSKPVNWIELVFVDQNGDIDWIYENHINDISQMNHNTVVNIKIPIQLGYFMSRTNPSLTGVITLVGSELINNIDSKSIYFGFNIDGYYFVVDPNCTK